MTALDRKNFPLWTVYEISPPIPGKHWVGTHEDYGGPPDNRCFTGKSQEDILQQIDDHEFEAENE